MQIGFFEKVLLILRIGSWASTHGNAFAAYAVFTGFSDTRVLQEESGIGERNRTSNLRLTNSSSDNLSQH
jgi:hypothetical protein